MDKFTTYEFYSNEYCKGRKPLIGSTDLFDSYAIKATKSMINAMCKGYEITDKNKEVIQMCCCELIENEYAYNEIDNTNTTITSEKTGSYSVTYSSANSRNSAYTTKVKNVIRFWLLDTGLLYRGMY